MSEPDDHKKEAIAVEMGILEEMNKAKRKRMLADLETVLRAHPGAAASALAEAIFDHLLGEGWTFTHLIRSGKA